jgi:uncharacterized RDD family membrane protein YckC
VSGRHTVLVHSPEHVEIALEPAGLGRRSTALLLDIALIGGGCGLIVTVFQLFPASIAGAAKITACFALFWAYWPLCELRWGGRTLGKQLLGLRVVDGRGLPLDGRQSVIRTVARALDMSPLGGVGLFTALLDRRRRRLGDLLADTLVVEERAGRYLAFAAAGERRYNSLRTPRMRRLIAHRLGAEDREFLLAICLRANAMAEAARHDLFEAAGAHFRAVLEIDDDRLTGEAVVRGLASVCHGRDAD